MTTANAARTREASIFSRYLLGRCADQNAWSLYEKAVAALSPASDKNDARVFAFALAHPWSLGPLDAALALTRPRALLRRKLLAMAAILETQPNFCDDFLLREQSAICMPLLLLTGLRSAIRAACGLLLLPLLR